MAPNSSLIFNVEVPLGISGFGDTDGFFRDWPDRCRTHQHGFVLQKAGLWAYVSEVCGIAGELINSIFLGLYLTTKNTR
jgi:hypothetical protein